MGDLLREPHLLILRPGRRAFKIKSPWHIMVDQLNITEKSGQAIDVPAGIGANLGPTLPAKGHLLDLK